MKFLLFFSSLLISTATYAQSYGAVSGKILDTEMNGEPLLFANISIKDTQWNTQTNLRGNFEISEIIPGDYILAVEFMGYETVEVPIEIKENEIIEVYRELRAKSIDVGAVLQAENVPTSKAPALITSRSSE